MSTTIKCDKCGHVMEVSEAITKELKEKVLNDIQTKHKEEIERLLKKQEEIKASKDREVAHALEISRKEALEKARKEIDVQLKLVREEADARAKQNKDLQEQLSKLMKELRESREIENKLKLDFEKRLLDEENKIKQKAEKEAEDKFQLTVAQKDKQLADLHKQLQEAQRKAQQGSQQLQGEVLELSLEEKLRHTFVFDDISEVPKGISGADIVQTVRTNSGLQAGIIVWEIKNTKAWSKGWIAKLKNDSRTLKADIPVLVSAVLPDSIQSFGVIDGVWVCDIRSAIPLAFALRDKIIEVRNVKEANKGKSTKAEIVYEYLISNEFKQRIEVWVEYFRNRREELEKEKAYFTKKWEKEDKSITKILQNTAGMYGDLQGLVGSALPTVKYLEPSDDI